MLPQIARMQQKQSLFLFPLEKKKLEKMAKLKLILSKNFCSVLFLKIVRAKTPLDNKKFALAFWEFF